MDTNKLCGQKSVTEERKFNKNLIREKDEMEIEGKSAMRRQKIPRA